MASSRPLLVARQSDRLGSRLHVILNAWGVAKVLDMEFRFVWPRNECTELNNPEEIFDQGFLQKHELAESAFSSEVIEANLRLMRPERAREFCHEHENRVVLMGVNFEIFAFAGEHHESAKKRFMAGLYEIGWSPAISKLLANEACIGFEAIHMRAGDIINGAWCQSWPVEKYLPTAYVDFIIRQSAAKSHLPIVVFSDNVEYVNWLRKKFKTVQTSAEIVPGYASLTESQRAFADAFMLSKASCLYGPTLSNFSQFASHIGAVRIVSISEYLGDQSALIVLLEYLQDVLSCEQPQVLCPLLARDICWLLDVFSDSLTLNDRITWAERAVGYDPGFCVAKNRHAIVLAESGHMDIAKDEASKALQIADQVTLYDDARFESLAGFVAIETLMLIAYSPDDYLLSNRHSQEIHKALEICEALRPSMLNTSELLINLRFIVASIGWLSCLDRRAFDIFRNSVKQSKMHDFSGWRSHGFAVLHTGSGPYPGLLRTLEEISIVIALAIGRTLSSSSVKLQRTVACGVEKSHVCTSGLKWSFGWAYHGQNSEALMIGFVCKGRALHGTFAALKRPDIAKSLHDPFALNCGFLAPMPRGGSMNGSDSGFVMAAQQPANWGQRFRNSRAMVRNQRDKLDKILIQRCKPF